MSQAKQEAKRIRRRAVSILLFASARGMEVGAQELYGLIRIEAGEGAEQDDELYGALTEREYNLVRQRYRAAKNIIEDVRKIANHLWKTSKKP